jgi:cysteate synthase
MQFRNREGYDLLPAACTAVAALSQAVQDGVVKKDDYIMLNCTGGGTLSAMSKGFVHKVPDLVLSPDLPADEVVRAVVDLF